MINISVYPQRPSLRLRTTFSYKSTVQGVTLWTRSLSLNKDFVIGEGGGRRVKED